MSGVPFCPRQFFVQRMGRGDLLGTDPACSGRVHLIECAMQAVPASAMRAKQLL